MKSEEIDRLRFKRQYILSPKKIECPFQNNCIELTEGYFLYSHIDLKVTEYKSNDISLLLLGDIFDYKFPEKNNHDILKELPEKDFNELLKKTDQYTGRYVLIYYSKNILRLTHDATACRKIFYCRLEDKTWCSSQPYLLAFILGLNKTKDESLLHFYNSKEFEKLNNSNIGDTTSYDEIRQLLPNHFIDVFNFEIIRFWPYKKIEQIPLNEVVEIGSEMIKGFVEAIAMRYDLMLPVTGGKDSRLLMAATHNISEKVFYYINKEYGLKDSDNDIAIPIRLFDLLKIDFHILDPYMPVDEDFKKVYFDNNEYASAKYFPLIYNYYKNFSDKVNLPGNFVVSSLEHYGLYNRKINGDILADINYLADFKFARSYYKEWLKNITPVCKEYNMEVITMFYWEERLANWGTQVHTDKDIAQEDIVPYNSRQLIEYFLSVNPKYIDRPDYILARKIIHKLWPELLDIPYNPSLKNKIIMFFKFFKIWKTIRKMQYYIKSLLISKNCNYLFLFSILVFVVFCSVHVFFLFRGRSVNNIFLRHVNFNTMYLNVLWYLNPAFR